MKCPKCHTETPPGTKFCSNCGTQLIPLNERPKEEPLSLTETLQTPVLELAIGSTFADRYVIIEELGRGGMGNVYKGLDKELGEKVALKLLKPEIAADERMIERFRNELKYARKITHKNVCRMYDLSKEKRTPYITMEYVSGEDLKTSLRRMGLLSVAKTIYIAKQVCEGLAEAHKLGVVHRDLKPQNIMIDKQGNAHIMDFGIARSTKAKGVTTSGMMIGTPDYMSPEQVEGKEVDQRADIYAMGVILYEMVTGTTPFHGETAVSIALAHTREKPRDPREINSQIPYEFSRMILKCMEKNRDYRYQKIEELYQELDRLEQSMPTTDRVIQISKPSTAKTLVKKPRLKKALIPVFVVLALIIIGVAAWRFTPLLEMIGGTTGPPTKAKVADYLKQANQSWMKKKYPEAYAQFKKALEVDPDNLDGRFGLANSLKEQGKLDEAIPEYEKAIALSEKDPRSYGQLGLIYEKKQDMAMALENYQKYLAFAPPGPEFNVVSGKVKDIEVQLRPQKSKPKEELFVGRGEQREPKTQPKEEVKATPSPEEKRKADVSAILDRGINAFNSKDYDGCINRMQDVLRIDARNTSAQYFLTEARKKKNEQAIEQEIETRLRLGQNAYQRGNYQESIKQAEEILKLAPGNASALSLLDRAGKKQEEKNTEQQIRDGLSKVQQAFRGENYEECITLANRVLSLDQENAQAKEYLNLANEKISMSQINALVNQYVQSVDSGKLLNFYESNCSSQCYLDVKKDAELVATYFSNLQSSAANVEVRFKGTDRAEVSFSNTISGTNKAGARQDVIKGVYKWDIQKQGKSWKIIRIEYTPRG